MKVKKLSNDVRALVEKNLREAETKLAIYKTNPTVDPVKSLLRQMSKRLAADVVKEQMKAETLDHLAKEVEKKKAAKEWFEAFHSEALAKPLKTTYTAENESHDGWFYQNCFFAVMGEYSEEEQELLVMEYADRERKKFERLQAKFRSPALREVGQPRERIPEEIRIAVWIRDGGKCARCGSRENLEYDHIVPLARGGSNTVRNIELLCENCNRAKSDHIQ